MLFESRKEGFMMIFYLDRSRNLYYHSFTKEYNYFVYS